MPTEHGGEFSKESEGEFKKRAEAWTGLAFDAIPKGVEGDLIGSHIGLKRGDVYVVGVGYPEQDEKTGAETYNEFKVIDLSENK